MPAKTARLDNEEAAEIIENETIGYAVLHYCTENSFEDPTTRTLWALAGAALNTLQQYLEREIGREID